MTRTRRMVGLLLVVLVSAGCAALESQALCRRGYDDTLNLFATTVDPVGDAYKWGGLAEIELEKAVLRTWELVKGESEYPIEDVIHQLGGDPSTPRNWGSLTYRFRKLSPPLVACIKRSADGEWEPLGEANVRRLQAYLQGVLFACRDQRFRPRVVLIPKRDALWIYRREW